MLIARWMNSHIVKLTLHFYAHVAACQKVFHLLSCKHEQAQTFCHCNSKKFLIIFFPSGVRMDSGWNCNPYTGKSLCFTAMTSP